MSPALGCQGTRPHSLGMETEAKSGLALGGCFVDECHSTQVSVSGIQHTVMHGIC